MTIALTLPMWGQADHGAATMLLPQMNLHDPFILAYAPTKTYYLYTSNQMVLTVGIVSDLIRGDVFQWGKIMAGCVIAAAPPIIIYAFLMDYYIAGLTSGATKG